MLVNMTSNPLSTTSDSASGSEAEVSPYRLSGIVYGTSMNDPAMLLALGQAIDQPPYRAPPRAPVLYIKPRNTLGRSGKSVVVPHDAPELEIGASLGLVIGRTACCVREAQALDYLAGYTVVADLSVPHDSFYRPSIRFKALDGSCLIGPQVVRQHTISDPDALQLQVTVDGNVRQIASTSNMHRGVARLMADVTEFMTLRRGDILLLGVSAGAPRAHAGQQFTIEIAQVGRLEGALVAAASHEQEDKA